MSIMARKPESDFEPCPEGLHQAVCVDAVDKGLQPTRWGEKHKVLLIWQIDQVDRKARRYQVRKLYTNSLHEKAALRKDLESWRSRRFTDEELKGFDLENLIGANCQLQIIHNTGEDGSVFANVGAIVPVPRSTAKLAPEEYVRAKDRAPASGPASTEGDDAHDIPF